MEYLFVILVLIIILCLFSKRKYEYFLTDEIEHVLRTDPPCLLTPQMKRDYDRRGEDYCSILSEKVCKKCNDCLWENKRCVKMNNRSSSNGSSPNGSRMKNLTRCSSTCKGSDGWSLTEDICKNCENCGWCIDSNYNGTCVKPDKDVHDNRPLNCTRDWEYQGVNYGPSGDIPKTKQCFMGVKERQSLKDEYATIGCNLYNFYEDCLKCKEMNKCSNYYVDGTVKCEECKDGNKPNCLASPTKGFGCPGYDFSANNIAPINPIYNDGVVCKYVEE